jgi:hypothetical protein
LFCCSISNQLAHFRVKSFILPSSNFKNKKMSKIDRYDLFILQNCPHSRKSLSKLPILDFNKNLNFLRT